MTWDRRIAPLAASLALIAGGTLAPAAVADDPAAQSAVVERIVATARAENRVMDHLDHLSNRIGPRLTGSDGLQDACEWAVTRFQSFGIANARLERWGDFPVGFNRGPWAGRMVEPTSKPLTFNTNAWTAGTRGPTRGPAVLAPETEEQLAAIKDKLPGAYVLNRTSPGARMGAEFRARREAAYAEAKVAGSIRSTRDELIVTGGNYRQAWEKLPEVPAIDLVKKEFDELAGMLAAGQAVTLEFDIRNHFRKGPIPVSNVVAEIPGTEHPDEFVVVGGHIDTWDGATGTTDNGTGCATTLEAARLIMASGIKPKRTILFTLWSGEEEGLLGSRAYVKAHPDLMPKISAVLVHDGGTNYLAGIAGTEAMQDDFRAVFGPIQALDPAMPFAIGKTPGLRAAGGSDHVPFISAGVPGFFWNQKGTAVYRHTHHTQFDTYDAAIPAYQKHSAVVAAIGAVGIANLDHLLSRDRLMAPAGAGGRAAGGGNARRTIGVALEDNKVVEVAADGLAERAGIKAGDLIIKVGDRAVGTTEEVGEAMQGGGPEVPITLIREGKTVEVKITFAAPGAA